jgi:uncharacterized membrane protein YoaK (UPF0700 family)
MGSLVDGRPEKSERHARAFPALDRNSMLLLLTWAAGSMDAISYLRLGQVFTAMMTGNTVLLGLAVGQGRVLAAARSILALVGFAVGVTMGAMVVQRGPRGGDWPSAVTGALVFEAILLGAFAVAWQITGPERGEIAVYVLIGLTALAMGVQSAAVQRLGVPGIMTTYITGTLTSLMVDLALWLRPAENGSAVAGGDRTVKSLGKSPVPREGRVGLLAAVFLFYALGALAGSFLQVHSFSLVTLLPFAAVSLVVGNATIRQRRQG